MCIYSRFLLVGGPFFSSQSWSYQMLPALHFEPINHPSQQLPACFMFSSSHSPRFPPSPSPRSSIPPLRVTYVFEFVHLSVLFVCRSVDLAALRPVCLVCLSACLSVCCLSAGCRSVGLSVGSVCLSVCLPACLPACLYVCLSVCLVCLPVCRSAGLSVCLSACLCL